ncbi:MAG: hypothetical protein ACFBZ9_00260 [Sphingomonadales bacterium]
MRRTSFLLAVIAAQLFGFYSASSAQEERAPIPESVDRLEALWGLTQRIDENAQRSEGGNIFMFQVLERQVTLVSDVRADRMRVLTPIAPEGVATPELLTRLMQANFDTALDARYAIARDIIWGVFIHPLSTLSNDDYLSAVGQTVNVAESFGTTFSSGALSYGGGDSIDEMRSLLEDLMKKNEEPL